MTACFVADVGDGAACTVHCHYLPCPYDGAPASDVPVHVDLGLYERAEVMRSWRESTGGRRPLIIHHGGAVVGLHVADPAGDCWCSPERVDAEDL